MQTPEETIKFVKEYLADPSCKTEGEVKANREIALVAALPAALTEASIDAAASTYDAEAALPAEYSDDDLSAYAALAADAAYVDAADVSYYWVKRYEKLAQKRINDGMDKRRR